MHTMARCQSKKKYLCPLCGNFFSRKATLADHITDVHPGENKGKRFKCCIGNCNYSNNRFGNFNIHIQNKHKIPLPILKCFSGKCGISKKREENLVRHMKLCVKKPSYFSLFCHVNGCYKELCTVEGLRTHMRICHSEEPQKTPLDDLMKFSGKYFLEK